MSDAWVCPKCRRVWAPYVPGCQPCNQQVEAEQEGRHAKLKGSIKEMARRVSAEFIPNEDQP